MIKRLAITLAASQLEVAPIDLLLAASDGEYMAEILTPKGYIVVSPESLKRAVENGFVTYGKNEMLPPAEGISKFEQLRDAHRRMRSISQEVSWSELYFRENEILKGVNDVNNTTILTPKESIKPKRKRKSRLAQQMATQQRDQEIRNEALKILDSIDGFAFSKDGGRPKITKLIKRILGTFEKNPKLVTQSITKDIVRKALVGLKIPRGQP